MVNRWTSPPVAGVDGLVIGSTVSHYTVLERLGGGGMGVVYRAEDTRLKRPVALKFLSADLTRDAEAKQRFVQEAQSASALDHPHVCTVHEIDETPDGRVFICMTYYAGESLRERILKGPFSVADALVIAIQIAEGLAATHDRGIVHRDIKPANVMLTSDGTVKIVDFGLATLIRRARGSRSGVVAGTLPYMAPEQARGEAADARTDIWAAGAVLYEMLTGHPPFGTEHESPVLRAIQEDRHPPISRTRQDVPQAVTAMIDRCLEKDPDKRFATARDLAAELRRVRRALRISTASTITGAPASGATSGRRRRRAAGLAAAAAAAALAVAILSGVLPGLDRVPGTHALPAKAHIAVLPFLNVGGEPANQAFIDGFVEVLASRLTQLRGREDLWVVPQSEVRAARVTSPLEAYRTFGATLVVTGALRRSGDGVQLTVNLVDPERTRQLRSWVLESREDALGRLDQRAFDALSDGLGISGGGAVTVAAPTRTPAPAAYDLTMQGFGVLAGVHGPGDPEAALNLFRRAATIDPAFALAQAGLGRAYLELFRNTRNPDWVEAAEASCTRAIALDASLAQVQVTLGSVQSATGRYRDAVATFRRVLEAEPGNLDASLGLARAYQALGRLAEAEATFRAATASRPDFWLPYHRLGNFYLAHQRWAQAEAQYEKVVTLTPDSFVGPFDLGIAYFNENRLADARAAFERSIALKPTYGAWSNLATLTYAEGKWQAAAEAFEKALAISDQDYLLWGNLGSAYRQLHGHEERERQVLREAISLAERRRAVNPSDPSIAADLASYHAMLGESTAAERYLADVRPAAGDDAALAFRVGETYEDMGRRDEALRWIARAAVLGQPAVEIMNSPDLAALRADPRFVAPTVPSPPTGSAKGRAK
jgi:tetratricopeptide (TPR) repeat protein/TolB-like protein